MGLVSELRRRNVLRMAVLYVVAAWLIMQVAEVIIGLAELPGWIGKAILALIAIGFPIAIVLSWFYELTPEGISLEQDVEAAESVTPVTGRRVDFIIIALLCAAVLLFAYDKWRIGAPPEKSIAVLAFANMSGDPDQEYFSDGISEEILNLLAQLPDLTVISRSSAFAFKGKDVPIPAIAEQLNVAHILEGSVRRIGDRVRITAQLIEARSDTHLWSETYDRDLDDVFAVQDEVAVAISDVLKVKLAMIAGEAIMPATTQTANREAYDAYLQGRELIHGRVKHELQEAIRYLERSISLDNSFASAHAQLAIATLLYHGYGHAEARRIASRHLDRAQELEPNLAEAHAGRALYASPNDKESAIRHARKALAVNPNYVDALNWLGNALFAVGHYEEAIATYERILVTDPLSIMARRNYATDLMRRGYFAEAHAQADRIIEQNPLAGYSLHARISLFGEGKLAETLSWGLRVSPNDWFAWNTLAAVGEYDEARRMAENTLWIDVAEGHWDDAIRAAQDSLRRSPDSPGINADAAHVLYLAGRFDEALVLYERVFESAPEVMPNLVWLPYYAMQLALSRRKAGDETGAQAAAQMARQVIADRTTDELKWTDSFYEAVIAAFDDDSGRAIEALKLAVRQGLKFSPVFDDPLFDHLRDDPRFIAVRQEFDSILADEHDKILQLICFNNPVPEDWQPLPRTCEGVVQQN